MPRVGRFAAGRVEVRTPQAWGVALPCFGEALRPDGGLRSSFGPHGWLDGCRSDDAIPEAGCRPPVAPPEPWWPRSVG